MKTVTYILKSGKELKFKCEDITIHTDKNVLVFVKVTEGKGNPFYTSLDEIAAILVK